MQSCDIFPVLDVLIGETKPVGSTHIDEEREKNLETLIDICNWCLGGIYECARHAHDSEDSVQRIGQRGIDCLYQYKNWIEKTLRNIENQSLGT